MAMMVSIIYGTGPTEEIDFKKTRKAARAFLVPQAKKLFADY